MWYIIRHGQTLENKLGVQQGQLDSMLTLKGVVQAQSIGHKLLEEESNFSKFKFVSSPLTRTKHTLQIIMEILGVSGINKLISEDLIINRNKGIFQGISKEKLKEMFPEEIVKQEKDPWNYIAPKATESKMLHAKRLQDFIEKYENEENLVIVSHRGTNEMLKHLLLGIKPKKIQEVQKKPYGSQNYFYRWNGKNIDKL